MVCESKDGVKLVQLSRSDLTDVFTDLGVVYGGRTYAIGAIVETDSHFNPHCSGSGGGSVHATRVEPGTPPVAIFTIYSWTDNAPWPSLLEDGGVEHSEGSSHRSLDETRCALLAGGPACTRKSIAQKDGPGAEADIERIPPLPW